MISHEILHLATIPHTIMSFYDISLLGVPQTQFCYTNVAQERV